MYVMYIYRTDAKITKKIYFGAAEIWSRLNGDAPPDHQQRRQKVSVASKPACGGAVYVSFCSQGFSVSHRPAISFCPGVTKSVSTACLHTLTLASRPAMSRKQRSTLRAPDLSPTSGNRNQTRSLSLYYYSSLKNTNPKK